MAAGPACFRALQHWGFGSLETPPWLLERLLLLSGMLLLMLLRKLPLP